MARRRVVVAVVIVVIIIVAVAVVVVPTAISTSNDSVVVAAVAVGVVAAAVAVNVAVVGVGCVTAAAAAVVVVVVATATAVAVVVVVVVVVVTRRESLESGGRRPMVNDLGNGGRIRMAVGVARDGVGSGRLEEVQGRRRWQRLALDLDRRQHRRRDVVRLHLDVRLRAEHVRVLRVQLLYARGDVLPQRRPEEHVVVARRRLTPRRDEARLRPAHRPPNLEEVLHLHRRLPRLFLRVIFVEFLQSVEILSTQQRVQVRSLLEIEDERKKSSECQCSSLLLKICRTRIRVRIRIKRHGRHGWRTRTIAGCKFSRLGRQVRSESESE